jgi:hypothetical protein
MFIFCLAEDKNTVQDNQYWNNFRIGYYAKQNTSSFGAMVIIWGVVFRNKTLNMKLLFKPIGQMNNDV